MLNHYLRNNVGILKTFSMCIGHKSLEGSIRKHENFGKLQLRSDF